MNDQLITVIIPVYNDEERLEHSLLSLFNTTFNNFEVIVVDDGSDDSPQFIVNKFPCKFIRLPFNRGQACARNIGVNQSRGDIILFTDADCLVMKDWVKSISDELIKLHQERKEIVALTGRLISKNGFIEMCHAYTGYGYIQTGPRREMDYLNTACVGIYKEAFLKIGGFSEDFKVNEDTDLGFKLVEHGYKVIFEPTISIFHDHGIRTFKEFILKHRNWGEALGLKFELRHKERLGIFLPLLSNPITHLFLIVPIAFLTTLKIVKYNIVAEKRVLFYFPFIFLGKISFRWGIFIHNVKNRKRY